MSARVPLCALFAGATLTAGPVAACHAGVLAVPPRLQPRAAIEVSATLARSGLYAVCGIPAGYALDRLWLTRVLADHHQTLEALPCLVERTCGRLSGWVLVGGAHSPPPCPCLVQQPHRAEPVTGLEVGVLENLERLLRAQKLCEKGERHLRAGRPDRARVCFEKVQQLCPGSRYDARATERLAHLAGSEQAVEEAEEPAPPPAPPAERKGVDQLREDLRRPWDPHAAEPAGADEVETPPSR